MPSLSIPSRVTVLFLLLHGAAADPARAQVDPGEFTIAGSIAGGVGDAVRDFGALVVVSAEATAEIEEARRSFWDSYPDGPGFAEAAARFADLLWQKDQLYMVGFLIEGVPAHNEIEPMPNLFDVLEGRAARLPTDHRNLAGLLMGLAGGIDGGIDPTLGRWYFDWVRAVRRGMGATNDRQVLLLNPLRYADALAQAEPEYREYVHRRDFGELFRGPKSPLRTDDPRQFLATVLFAANRVESIREGFEAVDLLQDFVGADAIAEVMRRPRAYRRGDAYMPGADPGKEIRPIFYDAGVITTQLFRRLRESEPGTARHWLGSVFMPQNWNGLPEAMARVQALMDEHGEERVLAAAERMRLVGRHQLDPTSLSDHSGHQRETDRWWLERLLENPDFPLPTITAPIVVDARNRALMEDVARRGLRPKVVGTISHARWDRPGRDDSQHHLRLYVEGAENFHFSVSGLHRPVLHEITGPEGEKVIGRRIGVLAPVNRLEDGTVNARILWPGTVEMGDIVTFFDGPVQTVAALPPGVAEQAGARVPGAEAVPDSRAVAQAQYQHRQRIDRFFRQELPNQELCSVPHGEYFLAYGRPGASVRGNPATISLTQNSRLRGQDPSGREGRPPRELWRSESVSYRQSARLQDLDWTAPSIERTQGDCLVLRVPITAAGASARMIQQAGGNSTEDQRSFLQIWLPDRATADRVVSLFRTYVEAAETGYVTAPPEDAPQARDRRRPRR
jgi:hypothetical protein